jgi:flagellar assembly factor FliW
LPLRARFQRVFAGKSRGIGVAKQPLMKIADEMEVAQARRIRIPAGLLGFESMKEFDLIARPDEDPFVRMQSAGKPSLSFVLISPFVVAPEYQPDLPAADVESLGLHTPDDALVLNIVTLKESGATVNLKGPIVVNCRTRLARQVVINNAASYSVQHPLPTEN